MQPCSTQKTSREEETSNLQVPAGTCKTLKLLPGSALTHGKVLIWSHGCMICGFFLAGNLCIPVDHPYSWCALNLLSSFVGQLGRAPVWEHKD